MSALERLRPQIEPIVLRLRSGVFRYALIPTAQERNSLRLSWSCSYASIIYPRLLQFTAIFH